MATMATTPRHAARRVRHLFAKHPFSTATLAGVSGVYAYASYVEAYNERNERLYHEMIATRGNGQDDVVPSASSSSDDGDVLLHSPPALLPRQYDKDAIETYWSGRPITVASRIGNIAYEMLPLLFAYARDFKVLTTSDRAIKPLQDQGWGGSTNKSYTLKDIQLQRHHASKLRLALTRLGPAFIKGGQQLSIRPDLVPPAVLAELQKLCDAVEPVKDEIALNVLRTELGLASVEELSDLFEDLHLVASASLGQVYKAKIKQTGEQVAIKVQRPDMVRKVSLDLYLLQKYASFLDTFTAVFTKQAPFHEELLGTFARGSYSELDYENEASNQSHFKTELSKRRCKVFVPAVFTQFTTQRVITTEWVDGVKLANAPQEQIRKLIPVGVELFLTQLLDMGVFHADPHPGNLYVTKNDTLCLLDFGLCAEVDERSRNALTTAIFHLLTGDFDTLVSEDAKKLGFLPDDLDTKELQPILTRILTEGVLESGSNLHMRKRKLMEISNDLNEVFFRYPFSIPPFFALVTRGLGLLEGIALSGDPNFDIFQASYPYAKRRAIEIFGSHGLNRMRRKLTNNQS